MSLLIVGSVALDHIEAPAGAVEEALGGAACYASVAASYFTRVRAIGVAGEDFPQQHIDFLAARGIDVSGIERARGRTFRWRGRYHESLDRRDTLLTELGVFERFDPRLPESHRESDWVFLANIHPSLQRSVLEQARRPRFSAMDSMNLWIDTTRAELLDVIRRVDCVILNDEEARQLTERPNLVQAGEAVRALGPRSVVVKRGESGALLFDEEGIFAAPAFPLRDVVDPTGAGDCFAGAFMGSLARSGRHDGASLRQAMIYGSTVASFCVERFGLDRFRSLEAPEIEARFTAFRDLTRF
jgi:sugar/nucleoside kinase (ribokinase family)